MRAANYIAWLIFFWIIALLFYAKTQGGGLVTDVTGWFSKYNELGWNGIPITFNDKALHHVYHLFFFILYKLFGFNGKGWMLSFTLLHVSSATLLFHLLKRIFRKAYISSSSEIAFVSAVFFLLSPYQVEPVVWAACIHYLLTAVFLLSAFHSFFNYAESNHNKWIIIFYGLFIAALLSIEIALIFPVLLFCFIALAPASVFSKTDSWQLQLIFVAPSFVVVTGYFLLNKLLLGAVVGHYGASTHLNFSPELIIPAFCKYIAKFISFSQFFPYDTRKQLYDFFEMPASVYFIIAFILLSGILLLWKWNSFRNEIKLLLLFLLCFAIGLLPVLNLYFSYLLYNEGDRFSYFASLFFFPFLVLFLYTFLPKVKYLMIAAYLFFSIKYLHFNTQSFSQVGKRIESLTENFKWNDAERIFILNIPDNYRGAYLFRSFGSSSSFAETMKLMFDMSIEEKVAEVVQYNIAKSHDSVKVEILDDKRLKLKFAQWGNWFWRNGIGATSYENQDYKIDIDEWSHSYTITFFNKDSNTVYLYECAGNWREVKGF
jgi:protein O-mannosyl-transferase